MATTYAVGLEFRSSGLDKLDAMERKLLGLENTIRGIGNTDPLGPIKRDAPRAQSAIDRLKGSFASLQGVLAAAGAAVFLRDLAQTGQAAANASRQLKFLSDEFGEYGAAQAAVVRIQKELGLSSTDATKGIADLYAALRPTGTSLRDIESAFVGFNKAARRSGASAAEASAGALQLKQALGSGVLQGDELRSLREQAPALSQAIAKAMGVSVGELKKLGEQGKITSAVVIKALKDLEAGSAPPLTAIDRLNTAFTELKTSIAADLGPATSAAVGALASLLEGFQKLPPAIQGPIKDVLTFGVVVVGLATAFGGLLAVLPLVTAGMTAFVAVLAPLAVPAAIVGGIVLITKAAYDLNEPFRNFVNDIPAKFAAFWSSVQSQGVAAIERLTKTWNAFVDFFTGAMDAIRKAAVNAFGEVAKRMGVLGDVAKGAAGFFRDVWITAMDAIGLKWGQIVEGLINAIIPFAGAVKTITGFSAGEAVMAGAAGGRPSPGLTLRRSISDYPGATKPAATLPSSTSPSIAAAGGGGGGGATGRSGAAQNSNVDKLLATASRNLGLFAGQSERCADAIAELYKQSGIAIGVTKKAWDGLGSGGSLASRFFGSDIGQKITNIRDLKPGDLVGFERTYGSWGPGVQTHVGMYAGNGMMFDHSSRRGLVKRPLDTFGGKFMYGVRPYANQSGSGGGDGYLAEFGRQEDAAAQEAARQAKLEDLKANVKYGKDALAIEERINAAKLAGNRLEETLAQHQIERLQWQKEYDDIVRNTLDIDERKLKLEEQNIKLQKIDRDNAVELAQLRIEDQNRINALMVEKARLAEGAIRPLQDEIDLLQAQLSGTEDLLAARRELAALTNAGVAPDAARGLIAKRDDLRKQREAQLKDPKYRLNQEIGVRQEKLDELLNPATQLISAADSIGEAFGQAFQDIASGSKTAKEAMADMFSAIGASFIQMAAKIAAEQLTLGLMKMFMGALGGGLGGGGGAVAGLFGNAGILNSGIGAGFGGSFAGGGYTGDGARSGGVDGMGGFPAILHPQETVIDHTRPSSAVLDTFQGSSSSSDEPIRVETTTINSVEYATVGQVRAASAAAAKQGEARALNRLYSSTSTRKRLGM